MIASPEQRLPCREQQLALIYRFRTTGYEPELVERTAERRHRTFAMLAFKTTLVGY
jgi:hypothetical protein